MEDFAFFDGVDRELWRDEFGGVVFRFRIGAESEWVKRCFGLFDDRFGLLFNNRIWEIFAFERLLDRLCDGDFGFGGLVGFPGPLDTDPDQHEHAESEVDFG